MSTWKVDYGSSEKPESEEEWCFKKGDLRRIQTRWTETLESGKLKSVAPQSARFLDGCRDAIIIDFWKELKDLDNLPSAGVQIEILKVLTVEMLENAGK